MKRSVNEGIEDSTNLGPKKAKSKEHGNYDRYYGYRKPQGGEKGGKSEDVRLDVLKVRIIAWRCRILRSSYIRL